LTGVSSGILVDVEVGGGEGGVFVAVGTRCSPSHPAINRATTKKINHRLIFLILILLASLTHNIKPIVNAKNLSGPRGTRIADAYPEENTTV
jgi:hypothetical protein